MSIAETLFFKKLVQVGFKEIKTTRFGVLRVLKGSFIL